MLRILLAICHLRTPYKQIHLTNNILANWDYISAIILLITVKKTKLWYARILFWNIILKQMIQNFKRIYKKCSLDSCFEWWIEEIYIEKGDNPRTKTDIYQDVQLYITMSSISMSFIFMLFRHLVTLWKDTTFHNKE